MVWQVYIVGQTWAGDAAVRIFAGIGGKTIKQFSRQKIAPAAQGGGAPITQSVGRFALCALRMNTCGCASSAPLALYKEPSAKILRNIFSEDSFRLPVIAGLMENKWSDNFEMNDINEPLHPALPRSGPLPQKGEENCHI